jgi:hypothetical protein
MKNVILTVALILATATATVSFGQDSTKVKSNKPKVEHQHKGKKDDGEHRKKGEHKTGEHKNQKEKLKIRD